MNWSEIYVYIVTAIFAYLIGSISFSVLISKKMAGIDVREHGSGNAGSTNVLRTVGKGAAVLTLICDLLKGIIAVLIALLTAKMNTNIPGEYLVQTAAIAVVIGHVFPVFFKFKGGKGVATSLGILLIVNWKIGLICLIFALAIMAITKMVSLGSISAAVLFPILTIFIEQNYIVPGNYIIFGIILALIVIFNHRKNIKRIINGSENKLGQSKKTETEEGENLDK